MYYVWYSLRLCIMDIKVINGERLTTDGIESALATVINCKAINE